MTKPIQCSSSPLTYFILKTKPLAQTVVRVAIQILFIGGVLLMSAAAFPIRFHAVLLPVIALSSTLFAAHFYDE